MKEWILEALVELTDADTFPEQEAPPPAEQEPMTWKDRFANPNPPAVPASESPVSTAAPLIPVKDVPDCKEPGCEKGAHTGGYCRPHYQKHWYAKKKGETPPAAKPTKSVEKPAPVQRAMKVAKPAPTSVPSLIDGITHLSTDELLSVVRGELQRRRQVIDRALESLA